MIVVLAASAVLFLGLALWQWRERAQQVARAKAAAERERMALAEYRGEAEKRLRADVDLARMKERADMSAYCVTLWRTDPTRTWLDVAADVAMGKHVGAAQTAENG